MRVAFITTEYAADYRTGGGLGTYLARMCRALVACGHTPEVFVTSDRDESAVTDGVLVHRVDPARWMARFDALRGIAKLLRCGRYAAECSAPLFGQAMALACALRRRERAVRFDCVQSADYQAAGLFVTRRRGRPRVVRCSTAADLCGFNSWQCFWERVSIRRADRAYAPSRFVANYLHGKFGLEVDVIRPPVTVETVGAPPAVRALPERYLIHFGQIVGYKGSDFLAEALSIVWRKDPSVRMVWAGRTALPSLEPWRTSWGDWSEHVVYLGAIERPELQQILSRAEGSVLPSMVDNLPNTVIESLMWNKPVIGTRGSSIDEIVVNDVNGLLVDYGDTAALAAAILKIWRDGFAGPSDLLAASPIWQDLQPEIAVANFFRFALDDGRRPVRRQV